MNFWRAGTHYPFVWNIKETGLSYKYRNAQLEHILLGGGGSVANARAAASTTTGKFPRCEVANRTMNTSGPQKAFRLEMATSTQSLGVHLFTLFSVNY